MLVRASLPQLFSGSRVQCINEPSGIAEEQRGITAGFAHSDARSYLGLHSGGPLHATGEHVESVDAAILAACEYSAAIDGGLGTHGGRVRECECPFQFQPGQIVDRKPASFADWNLVFARPPPQLAHPGPSLHAAPAGHRFAISSRFRSRVTAVPRKLAILWRSSGRKRRGLLLHDAAFQCLLNGAGRHGFQRGYLRNSSAGSGLGVMAGGAMFLKKLRRRKDRRPQAPPLQT